MIRDVPALDRWQKMAPDEAAAQWMRRRAAGMNDGERAMFERWRAADPRHARAWDQAERAWAAFDGAQDDELVGALLARARASRTAGRDYRLHAIAASLLVMIGATSIGVWYANRTPSKHPPSVATTTYATRIGEIRRLRFADGTTVTLDAASRISVTGAHGRTMRLLTGRAAFDVTHDPMRPFRVDAGFYRVVDLGTRFNVRVADGGGIGVVLTSGRVEIAGDGRPALAMRVGQSMTVSPGNSPVVRAAFAGEGTDWQRGLLRFDNKTLAEVVTELNRYGPGRLSVRDPKIAGLRISGAFRAGDLDRFGRSVAAIYPVRMISRGSGERELLPRD